MYKIIKDPIDGSENITKRKSDNRQFGKNPENYDYQQFLQDVKERGIDIVEGPDVVTPDYKQQRVAEYPSIEDQLDKIYHSTLTAWKADIKAVKDKYPKTNSGSTTVGSVPSWVQEEVDKLP